MNNFSRLAVCRVVSVEVYGDRNVGIPTIGVVVTRVTLRRIINTIVICTG